MRSLRLSTFGLAIACSLAACGNPPKAGPDAGLPPEQYFGLQKGRCFEYTTSDVAQTNPALGVVVERMDSTQFPVPTYEVTYRIGGGIAMLDYVAFGSDNSMLLYKRSFPGGKTYLYDPPLKRLAEPVVPNDRIRVLERGPYLRRDRHAAEQRDAQLHRRHLRQQRRRAARRQDGHRQQDRLPGEEDRRHRRHPLRVPHLHRRHRRQGGRRRLREDRVRLLHRRLQPQPRLQAPEGARPGRGPDQRQPALRRGPVALASASQPPTRRLDLRRQRDAMNRTLLSAVAALACFGLACTTAKPAPEEGAASTGAAVSAETFKLEEQEQVINGLKAVASVRLKNETAEAVTVSGASWEVVIAGKVVASGRAALSASVPGGGETTVEVPAPFVYAQGDEAVAALVQRKEPIEYAVRGTLDAGGSKVEFAKAGAIRAPRMPSLKMASLDATTAPSVGVAFSIMVDLENPNTFPLVLQSARWKLTVAGKQAGEGVFDRTAPKAASHTSFPIEVLIPPEEVKERKELQGSTVPYALEAEIDLGAAKVKLEQAAETRLLRAGD
ncbi:MAG: LEA type 2 family protein [Myxococcales bacterium]